MRIPLVSPYNPYKFSDRESGRNRCDWISGSCRTSVDLSRSSFLQRPLVDVFQQQPRCVLTSLAS